MRHHRRGLIEVSNTVSSDAPLPEFSAASSPRPRGLILVSSWGP